MVEIASSAARLLYRTELMYTIMFKDVSLAHSPWTQSHACCSVKGFTLCVKPMSGLTFGAQNGNVPGHQMCVSHSLSFACEKWILSAMWHKSHPLPLSTTMEPINGSFVMKHGCFSISQCFYGNHILPGFG